MLSFEDKDIIMVAGNYGKPLHCTLKNGDFETTDIIKISIKETLSDTEPIFVKEFTNLVDNGDNTFGFDIIFTKEESSKFTKRDYIYSLTQYRNDKDGKAILKDTFPDAYCNKFTVKRGV